MSVYEQVKQALQDIVAPELKALQIEIKRLDEKIEAAIDEKLAVHPEPDAFDVWSKVDAILQKKRAVNE